MKRNNDNFDRIKALSAKRLNEVMQLKGMDRTAIRRILSEKYNYPIERQTYDKYQKGINSMPPVFMKYVSEILEIYEGYLLGDDNFENFDYGVYCLVKDPVLSEYEKLFSSFNLNLGVYDDGNYEVYEGSSFAPTFKLKLTKQELLELIDNLKKIGSEYIRNYRKAGDAND